VAFDPQHVPEIAGVIQLAIAPVFMLTAVGTVIGALRIRYVDLSIVFAVISALFVALLIAGAFIGAFVRTDLSFTIAGMFVCAMLALIVCLLLFLREIFLAVSTPRYVPR
jgi:hypothetical protein